jgi:hypothetical protein
MNYESQMLKMHEYKRQMKASHAGGATPAPASASHQSPKPPLTYNICIYRIKYKTPDTSSSGPKAATAKKKGLGNAAAESSPAASTGRQMQQLLLGPSTGMMAIMPKQSPLEDSAASAAAESSSSSSALQQQGASGKKQQAAGARREFEYVNIPKLYHALRDVFSGMCPSCKRHPLHHYQYMRMLAVLIGLGGTDFSRGLPYIGVCTLWAMLPEKQIFSSLLQVYNPRKGVTDAESACDSLACNIYMKKFATHFKNASPLRAAKAAWECDGDGDEGDEGPDAGDKKRGLVADSDEEGGFEEALTILRGSSLSEKTRKDLPSYARINTTFRNINWLLHYWTCVPPRKKEEEEDAENEQGSVGLWDYSICYPDPVCPKYGFKFREQKCTKKRRVSKGSGKTDAGDSKAKKNGGQSAIQWLDEDEDGDECDNE